MPHAHGAKEGNIALLSAIPSACLAWPGGSRREGKPDNLAGVHGVLDRARVKRTEERQEMRVVLDKLFGKENGMSGNKRGGCAVSLRRGRRPSRLLFPRLEWGSARNSSSRQV